MSKIKLVAIYDNNGWPDLGRYYYYIMKVTPRKSKFWQWLLGDKNEKLMFFGDECPCDEDLDVLIKKYERIHNVSSQNR